MIKTLGRVSAFWWGKKLSVIEIASMLSMQRAGHQIQLFSYEKPRQLPAGVAWFNAAEILPKESFVFFRGNNPALGANLFRYKLMAAEKGIWMGWGVWGPLALTYFIKKNRHEHLARAREVFYPVHHSEAHMLVTSGFDVDARIGPSTLAVHLWNAKLRQPSKIRPAADRDQIHIDSDSYFGRFCRKELQLKVSG